MKAEQSKTGWRWLVVVWSALVAAFITVTVAIKPESWTLLAYFSNLNAGLTHYGTTPAPIYFGTGYVKQKNWRTIGLLASIVNILVWSVVGLIRRRVLGWC